MSGPGPEVSPEASPQAPPAEGVVYLLPISHLDTQWRWTVRESASLLLPRTVRENAAAFARFPSYCVNFDGAFRYRLLAEHHPEDFAELRRWVDAGRWKVAGATWDAMDVNLPSPESLVRHVLLGRRWFRRHLGQDPRDLFLPDCFGFGAQVPVVAAHCGLVGFATSKLRRFGDMRAAFGIPFPLCWWQGVDGARLLAILEPGGYGEPLLAPPGAEPEVCDQLRRHQLLLGRGVAVRFFGIGDRGGAPPQRSLETLERAVASDGAVKTVAAGSDETLRRLARELPADKLPVHHGELLLRLHGTGCYTSQVAMKEWNARNERTAAAAERAAAAAAWLGATPYPAPRLREAWRRFLWHQFHDDLTGTSIPAAYRISWHDEALAASAFAGELRAAVAAVARGLDTRATGLPLVVFNPVARARRELVAARVPWRGSAAVVVVGPDGAPVPAQLDARDGARERAVVRFVAELPAMGFAVFDVREADAAATIVADPELATRPRCLENGRYRLALDDEGNLASLFDRALDRELLAAPLSLELFADRSTRFPAWEVRHEDLAQGPVAMVGGPAEVRALPAGPAAVALEVRRRLGPSTFVERYRLAAAGAGDHLEISIDCRWRHRGRLLKLTLTGACGGRDAIYDAGVAGVARGLGSPSLYEVPAQSWADLPDASGGFGLAMLTDRAGGWDHPSTQVLRRTLVRTPAIGRRFRHQGLQDLGDHRWALALTAHDGDWRRGDVPALAERFRNPPRAFVVEASAGPLGKVWSFLDVEGGELSALKEHEDGGEWVARVLDPVGRGGRARVRFSSPLDGWRELDGCEDAPGDDSFRALGIAAIGPGRRTLEVERPPFRPVTLGVRLEPPSERLAPARNAAVHVPFDRAFVSRNGERRAHGFGPRRLGFPAELWPVEIAACGTVFQLAPVASGTHAASCAGQRLALPPGAWDRLWLLAAASGAAELEATVAVGVGREPALVPSATAALAREDEALGLAFGPAALWRVRRGYRREGAVAFTVDHAHDPHGRDVAYTPLSLFAVDLPLPGDTADVTLPVAPAVLVFAATVTGGAGWARVVNEERDGCEESPLRASTRSRE